MSTMSTAPATPTFQKTLHPTSSFLLLSFTFHKARESLSETYLLTHLRSNILKFSGEYGSFDVSLILFTLQPRPLCIIECQRKFLPLLRLCLMRDWNIQWHIERVANVLWRVFEEERGIYRAWRMEDDLDMGNDALDEAEEPMEDNDLKEDESSQ
mmetsp:Transcript_10697/g.40008  ORF Transcript_10697/g.40008 Transcript_10697/m.40008 type:complete len:155 (-) Transcript_10697:2774-3238(-)